MRVLSPVGTFPMRLRGVRWGDGGPVIDAAMGAWRSQVRLERRDLPLVGAAIGIVAAAFFLGRLSLRRAE